MNTDYRVRLHSHDVKYGTGSGQQSVTGTEIQEDVNSHWLIKAATGKICPRGESIKCGSVIRLEHLATNKNLHSHHFSSPLSSNQEISCYGDNGEGDTGDHWTVICSGKSFLLLFRINLISKITLFEKIKMDLTILAEIQSYKHYLPNWNSILKIFQYSIRIKFM